MAFRRSTITYAGSELLNQNPRASTSFARHNDLRPLLRLFQRLAVVYVWLLLAAVLENQTGAVEIQNKEIYIVYMGGVTSNGGDIRNDHMDLVNSLTHRKLIGARYYVDPEFGPYPMVSPRDGTGHGTHVASTAAGRSISGASYYGLARGTATGGSPNSRIAMYRVCSPYEHIGCPGSVILKAFDDAIVDGVDILSISINTHSDDLPPFSRDPIAIGAYHAVQNGIFHDLLLGLLSISLAPDSHDLPDFSTDATSIGAYHAVQNGITVVCSAGNNGPNPGTVRNVAPWILTVGATTIDREFMTGLVLGGRGAGNQKMIKESHLSVDRWGLGKVRIIQPNK